MTKYEINERDEVIPYMSGRQCTDTRAWRDATDLEIEQRDEINRLREGIKTFVTTYDNISWGNDGDCGSQNAVDILENL